MIRIGINGFGRIGRLVFREAFSRGDIEIKAINSTREPKMLAHLLKYDSTYGIFKEDVTYTEDAVVVNGKETKIVAERDPAKIQWASLGVDIVIESTGKFKTGEQNKPHLDNGAKKVIICAPGKQVDGTFVVGVNCDQYDPAKHHVMSNASCTTNCLAPAAKVIHDNFGIERAFMTTIHAYTGDQRILDGTHKDFRRARSAADSMIPTTTGAAKALAIIIPDLKGKFDGMAIRVPTNTVSIVDLTMTLSREATAEEVNAALKKASETTMKGILGYEELPLVSIDYKGDPRSGIVDALSTNVNGNLLKLIVWYDNEWGYACRVVDLLQKVGCKL